MDTATFRQPMIFISDVHLGGFANEENSRIESELIQLINYCQRNEIRIAVLGDLFDYWMEYPDKVPELGERLLARFKSFNNKLGPSLFITGNHDNWTRDYLLKCGFQIEHEHEVFSLQDDTIMALHGDGLTDETLQLERPPMHRLLRNSTFVSYYQKFLPAPVGITIMKHFSRISRFISSNTGKAQKLNKWAYNTLNNKNIDIIICGHDHIPRMKQFDFGTYINLGTFYKHRTVGFYNNGAISLVCWKPRLQSITSFE